MSDQVAEAGLQYVLDDVRNVVLEGYKQTEVGLIPVDWEVVTMAEAASIIDPQPDHRTPRESATGDPYIGISDFGSDQKVHWDSCRKVVSAAALKQVKRFKIKQGDIINKPKYCDEPFWTVDTLFYSEISQDVDARFLYYKFCMIDWMQFNEASGVPSLNASTIEKVAVSMLRKEEQMKISVVFAELDISIRKQLHRLNKIRQIKQGMMQELLTGKIRLFKPSVKESANV